MEKLAIVATLTLSCMFSFLYPVLPVPVINSASSECARNGPSYWCSSVETAHLCNAAQFCGYTARRLSKESHSQDKNGVVCTMCHNMVAGLHSYVDKNKTEQEMIQGFHKVCALLRTSLKEICDEVVRLYAKKIIFYLDKLTVDPDHMCRVIGLCSSKWLSANQPVDYRSLRVTRKGGKFSDGSCPVCLFTIYEADFMLRNKTTQVELKKDLNALCSRLPAMSGVCEKVLALIYDPVYEIFIWNSTPEQICSMLQLCEFYGRKLVVNSPAKLFEFWCQTCEMVMFELDYLNQNATTQAQWKEDFRRVCDVMPTRGREICTGFINEFFDPIFNYVFRQLTPTEVCSALSIC